MDKTRIASSESEEMMTSTAHNANCRKSI